MHSARRLLLLSLFIVATCSGCGMPKVNQSPLFSNQKLRTVAILPPSSTATIPRERVATLRTALENEVTNHGLSTIDRAIIDSICTDSTCRERDKLIARYPIDAFATLTIDKASRNNFLAGYYNSISGRLTLTDVEGNELLAIKHTESERGGLLFNSGQIFQGLISQIRNSDDAAFATLAAKYAQTVVTSIPRPPESDAPGAVTPPNIERTSIVPKRAAVYEICIFGSPNAQGVVVLRNKTKTNLREVSPGRYCSNYLVVDPEQFVGAEAELRDVFGTATRVALGALPPQSSDSCRGELVATAAPGAVTLTSPCPSATVKVLIYRAPAPAGPFEKIAERRGPSWRGTTATFRGYPTLALIAVDRNGLLSEPRLYTIEPKGGA